MRLLLKDFLSIRSRKKSQLITHWPEICHKVTLIYKEGWEMYSNVSGQNKSEFITSGKIDVRVNNYQILLQVAVTRGWHK